MKKISEPDLTGAVILTPAEKNKIHFGGNHTPITPEQLKKIADSSKINKEDIDYNI